MTKRTNDVSRRRFIRGIGGVSVGLPLLDAFSRSRRAGAAAKPVYSVFMVNANGVVQADREGPERFWPSKLGSVTTADLESDKDRATSELKDHANKLVFVKGVDMKFGGTQCGHPDGGCQVLTAAKLTGVARSARALGESVDNRIAREINDGKESLLLYAGRKGTYIDDYVAYRGPRQLRSGQNNPWNAYRSLVGLVPSGMGNELAEKIALRRRSVNDFIRDDLRSLLSRPELSGDDRKRLDLHLTSIRDLEIKMLGTLDASTVKALEAHDGQHARDENVVKSTRLMIDVLVFALAANVTKVAVLQVGSGADRTVIPVPGGPRGASFHMISHRIFSDGGSGTRIPNARELHAAIDRIHMQNFRYLLDKMAAAQTADGSLMDIGLAVWTNELATGPAHSRKGTPFISGGLARGAIKGGQVIDVAGAYNNKLLNTYISAVGIRNKDGSLVDDFGDPSLPRGVVAAMLKG